MDDSGPAGSPALENYLQDPRIKIQYITDLTFLRAGLPRYWGWWHDDRGEHFDERYSPPA